LATSESELEGENQLQEQNRLGERKENPRLVEKEPGIDYRFHMTFQQDF
jgi:hypothetical protein